jgi:hypothetical protein
LGGIVPASGDVGGKNTIDPRGSGVEKPREVTLTFFNLFLYVFRNNKFIIFRLFMYSFAEK